LIYMIQGFKDYEQLQLEDMGKLLTINEKTGERNELSLVSDKVS
jgi:hypothetical protein